MLVWPTSELPICPSGRPTSRPEAPIYVIGFSAKILSRLGVFAASIALPPFSSRWPNPSMIISAVGFFGPEAFFAAVLRAAGFLAADFFAAVFFSAAAAAGFAAAFFAAVFLTAGFFAAAFSATGAVSAASLAEETSFFIAKAPLAEVGRKGTTIDIDAPLRGNGGGKQPLPAPYSLSY